MSAAGARPVRVMIVDDHAIVRRGIRAYLEALEEMAVAAEAAVTAAGLTAQDLR